MITKLYQNMGLSLVMTGNSAMFSPAKVVVQEGYNIGSTLEKYSIGEYLVDTLSYRGLGQERISLSMSSQNRNMSVNMSPLEYKLKSGVRVWDTFDDYSRTTDQFEAYDGLAYQDSVTKGLAGGSTSLNILHLRTNVSGADPLGPIALVKDMDMRDGKIIVELANYSNMGVSQAFNIIFRALDENNFYLFQFAGWANEARFRKNINDDYTTLVDATLNYNIGVSNPIYRHTFVVTVKGNEMWCWGATDGKNFSDILYYKDTSSDNFYSGRWGVGAWRAGAGGSGWYMGVKSVMITENKGIYTNKDVLDVAGGWVNNVGVTMDTDTAFSNYESVASNDRGSCWVSVSDSIVRYNSTSSGLSMIPNYCMRQTYNSGVFECEVMGVSGTKPGLGFNNTFAYITLDAYSSDGSIFSYSSGATSIRTGQDFAYKLSPNTWYKYKLVKSDNMMTWYINNTPIASDLSSQDANLPVWSYFSLHCMANGGTVLFRNPKIYIDDVVIPEINLGVNSTVDSAIDPLMKKDTVIKSRNGYLKAERIADVGATGVIGVSLSFIDITEDKDYSIRDGMVARAGSSPLHTLPVGIGVYNNEGAAIGRAIYNLDSRETAIGNDDRYEYTLSDSREAENKFKTYTMTLPYITGLEVNDVIASGIYGTTNSFRVTHITKDFEARGTVSSILTLNKLE